MFELLRVIRISYNDAKWNGDIWIRCSSYARGFVCCCCCCLYRFSSPFPFLPWAHSICHCMCMQFTLSISQMYNHRICSLSVHNFEHFRRISQAMACKYIPHWNRANYTQERKTRIKRRTERKKTQQQQQSHRRPTDCTCIINNCAKAPLRA